MSRALECCAVERNGHRIPIFEVNGRNAERSTPKHFPQAWTRIVAVWVIAVFALGNGGGADCVADTINLQLVDAPAMAILIRRG